jgi:S1-C subfamily serine protease
MIAEIGSKSFKRLSMRLVAFSYLWLFGLCSLTARADDATAQKPSWFSVIRSVQEKVVKIYGAGGIAGLESYQTGILVSPEGHVLTAWSTVLDADSVVVVTTQGQRVDATLVGVDPALEIAVLKADLTDMPFFSLKEAAEAELGSRVLAVTNLFGIATGNEAPSVQKGSVLAKSDLKERRGRSGVVYQGPIYVVDAMTNNPGAAGGALTDWNGNLVGLVGKELRDQQTNTWLNYAIPVSQLKESVAALVAGKSVVKVDATEKIVADPHELIALGIILVPDVLVKTPAYVDRVTAASVAERAGLQPDDLIIMVQNQRIDSQSKLRSLLGTLKRTDSLSIMIQRGTELKQLKLDQK